jgi:hypothetical protein
MKKGAGGLGWQREHSKKKKKKKKKKAERSNITKVMEYFIECIRHRRTNKINFIDKKHNKKILVNYI